MCLPTYLHVFRSPLAAFSCFYLGCCNIQHTGHGVLWCLELGVTTSRRIVHRWHDVECCKSGSYFAMRNVRHARLAGEGALIVAAVIGCSACCCHTASYLCYLEPCYHTLLSPAMHAEQCTPGQFLSYISWVALVFCLSDALMLMQPRRCPVVESSM